jgi:sulfite dehydrogenase
MNAIVNARTSSRRAFLGASTALAASTLSACATSPSAPSLGRVVIIGGGFGGATAARYLKLWGGNIDVTLVERQAQFVSCPLSNMVIGGHLQMADITRGYDGLAGLGIKRLQDEAVKVDATRRTVTLRSGAVLTWDRLIMSPGIDFNTSEIGGLGAAIDDGRVVHAWKAGTQTVALRRQLEAMPNGGVYALSIPKMPYRCPPGPYERICMVASYFKQHKPASKVLVMDANPEITSKKALFEQAFAEHYKGLIDYRPNAELREVSGKVAKFDFEDVRADVLNVIPTHRAGDIARDTGLINVNQRWVGVNWLTMESTAVPGVHVLGDATASAPGMPKSGHMATQHAKLAAASIIQLLKGEAVNQAPVVMNTCYSFVTASDVAHVAAVYQYDGSERTFKPVPGAGGVSARSNALEARYAMAWAHNTWAGMLG